MAEQEHTRRVTLTFFYDREKISDLEIAVRLDVALWHYFDRDVVNTRWVSDFER